MTRFGIEFGAYGMLQGAKVEADTLRMQMSADKSRSLRRYPAPGPRQRHYEPRWSRLYFIMRMC